MPLNQLADLLQTRTRLPFRIDPNIVHRKIALSCSARPVREVMEAVAETMGMQWREEKGVQVLRLNPEIAKEERLAQNQAAATATVAMRNVLAMLAEFGTLSAGEKEFARRKAIANLAKFGAADHDTPEYKSALLRQRALTSGYPSTGQLFAGSVDESVRSFTEGKTLLATSGRYRGTLPLPLDLAAEIGSFEKPLESVESLAAVRLADGGSTLAIQGFAFSGLAMLFARTGIDLRPAQNAARKPTALDARMAKWSETTDASVLDLRLKGKAVFFPHRYSLEAYSTGDQLLELSRRSGVSFVADAFRLPASGLQSFSGDEVRSWVQAFNRPRQIAGYEFEPGYVRSSGGWLMFRTARYWEKLPAEPTEETLIRLENCTRDGGTADLDDYAAAAAAMTPAQFLGLDRPLLVCFQRRLLAKNRFLFRFWHSLGPAQRSAARGRGLSSTNLNPTQTDRLREAIVNLAFGSYDAGYLVLLVAVLQGEDVTVNCEVAPAEEGATIPDEENLGSDGNLRYLPAGSTTTLTIATTNPPPQKPVMGPQAKLQIALPLPTR